MFQFWEYTKRFNQVNITTSSSYSSEELTFIDWNEGQIEETRSYNDNFIDDLSYRESTDEVETLSITNVDTSQELEVEMPILPASDPLSIDWETPTYGDDNVPIKFESYYIRGDGYEERGSKYDDSIKIRITNRFSLYHDYLKTDYSQRYDEGSTVYSVEGIFTTPPDGQVFFTSDRTAFLSPDSAEAKTSGHYLFYDSDQNGFYETVFVLSPDENNDGIYDVMSIGYNYDGTHDFVPYQVIDKTTQVSLPFYASNELTSYGHSETDLSHRSILDAMDAIYFDEFDADVPAKDHIFEIFKLIRESEVAELMPELFYEVYEREYANAWLDFGLIKEKSIADQVQMTVIAGTASAGVIAATTAAWAPYAAPFVFAAVYFLLSWINSEEKVKTAKALNDAKTYYPSDSDFSEPTSLSQKTASDRLFDDSLAAYNQGHPGAYYTTVTGGEPGNMYTGELMVTPPNSGGDIKLLIGRYEKYNEAYESYLTNDYLGNPHEEPITQEDLDRLYDKFLASARNSVIRNNLDYLILSSELPALNGQEFYSFDAGISDSEDALINLYRYNTLGYLESEIETVSGGLFDTIRPMIINGIPQYRYVSTGENIISFTQPLSPLYGPIVVSQEVYDDLEIEDAKISVKAQVAYLDNTEGVDASKLELSEITRYKAKINLAEKYFAYDISLVTVDVWKIVMVEVIEDNKYHEIRYWKPTYEIADSLTVELSPNDYKLEGGTLYFYDSLEELVFGNQGDFDSVWSGENGLTFSVNVHFPIIVPDTLTVIPSLPDIPSLPGLPGFNKMFLMQGISQPKMVLDTTTNEYARNSLAQTTQHAINDYFNLYTVAATNALSQAELEFTVEITFASTIISSIILLPVSLLAQATRLSSIALMEITKETMKEISKEGMSQLTRIALEQALAFTISPFAEIIEEVYVDSFIEAWIEGQFAIHGGDEQIARFVSMLVTSLREASNTGLDIVVGAFGTDSDSQSDLQTQKTKLEQDVKLSWKSLVSTETVMGLTMAALSFASANVAFGMGFLGGVFGDTLGVPVEEFVRIQTVRQALSKTDRQITEINNFKDKMQKLIDNNLKQSAKPFTVVSNPMRTTVVKARNPQTTLVKSAVVNTEILQDNILAKENQKQEYELTKFKQESIDALENIKDVKTSIESQVQDSLGIEPIPVDFIDAPELSEEILAEAYDPRFRLLGKGYDIELMRLDVPSNLEILTAEVWIKEKFRLKNNIKIFYGRTQLDGLIQTEIRDINNVKREIVFNTKLSDLLEWLGYSLHEELYIVEFNEKGERIQDKDALDDTGIKFGQVIAKSIAKAKWRIIQESSSSQIGGKDTKISTRFPGYWRIKQMWSSIYSGVFNFRQMGYNLEDVQAFEDLYNKLVLPLSINLLKDNKIYRDGMPFDVKNLNDQFKKSYYDLKFMTKEVTDKITTSTDSTENDRRLNEWEKLIEATYMITCEPAFSPQDSVEIFAISLRQAQFTVLDTIMRSQILIDMISDSTDKGGPNVYEVSKRIRKFLNDEHAINDVSRDLSSPEGRMAFFTFFREAFFDDAQNPKLAITKELRSVVGRDQEASDYFGDLILRYVNRFISSGYSFVGLIDAVNYGNGKTLGGNNFLNGLIPEIETSMLGIDISEISKWAPSDRRFFDNFIAIFLDAYLANPTKGTSNPKGISSSQRSELVNDWISGQFFTVLNEMSKEDAKIRDILPYLVTLVAPSNNPASTLKSIMQFVAKRTIFDSYRSGKEGSKLKMPSKYVYLFEFAKFLSNQIDLKSTRNLNDAVQRIQDYINNNEEIVANKMTKLAEGIYSSTKNIKPQFYQAIVQFFTSETQLKTLLRNRIDGGYDLTFNDYVNMLFKHDVDGATKLLTTTILPSGIEIFDGSEWVVLPNNYKFDSAHVLVHYKSSSGQIKNGILKVDTIQNTLPNDIYEGYYDFDTNTVLHNIYLCDSTGQYLFSEVKIVEDGEANRFEVRKDEEKHKWYEKFIDKVSKSTIKSFYISFGISSGNQFTFFLQNTVLSHSTEAKSYKKYFPSLKVKNLKSNLDSTAPLLIANIENDLYYRINSFISFLYQLGQYKSTSDDIIITDQMVQLEGELAPNGEQYSFDYYRKILAKLSPSEADLNNLDILDEKVFYKTLLKLFKAVIGQELFKDYKSLQLIKDLQFSIGDELIVDNQNDDLTLIVKVNQVLKEIMGYSGSILFKLGFITFEKIAVGSYEVKSVGQTYEIFIKYLKKSNIKPIFSSTSYQTIQELVSSIMLVGYIETIEYSKFGIPDSRNIRYEQRKSILSELFNRDTVMTSINNKYLMLDIFLKNFYSKYKISVDYTQLGRALSEILNSQIDRYTETLLDLGMEHRFIESYRNKALISLYSYLYSADEYGASFRGYISNFLTSPTKSADLILKTVKDLLPVYLKAYPSSRLTIEILNEVFATVKLTLAHYDKFLKPFADIRIKKFLFATDSQGDPYRTDNVLRSRREHITKIANFLAYMAKYYGGSSQKIRIYGYAQWYDGLGYEKVGNLAYYPEPNGEQDWLMPTNNLRYFELDFNDLDNFDFILFLGAFLADSQTFIVKTEGMAGNEFLFAFNAITGAIDIGNLYSTLRTGVKPFFLKNLKQGLEWADNDAQEDLATLFNSIMDKFKRENFITMHRHNDITVWRKYCERISGLRAFSALINLN